MTSFEFVFSLLVILLGLGLGQVLSGLARVIKRPGLRLGWGTGLLATWVTTETIIFWLIVWRTRDVLPPTSPALYAGFIITGLYFFAAASVFPDELEGRSPSSAAPQAACEATNLDDYFMAEKAKVIGAVLAAFTMSFVLRPLVLGAASWNFLTWFDWASLAMIYVFGLVAIVTKGRNVAVACLALLVVVDLLEPVGALLWPS